MNVALRPGLPTLPDRMKNLHVDERGYPVPWFVAWVNGKPEFRAMDRQKFFLATQKRLCWICGDYLEVHKTPAFVIGPMCAVTRTSGEPPSHEECARFAAMACPFLVRPYMVRRDSSDLKALGSRENPSHIDRNPGVAMLWFTSIYHLEPDGASYVCKMGPAFKVECYAQGRPALEHEMRESIEGGMPILRNQCDGNLHALAEIARMRREAYKVIGLKL